MEKLNEQQQEILSVLLDGIFAVHENSADIKQNGRSVSKKERSKADYELLAAMKKYDKLLRQTFPEFPNIVFQRGRFAYSLFSAVSKEGLKETQKYLLAMDNLDICAPYINGQANALHWAIAKGSLLCAWNIFDSEKFQNLEVDRKRRFLINKDDCGFTLVQEAVAGGNEAILTRAMDEAKAALGDKNPEFKALFTDKTDAFFTLMQHAAASENEVIFTRIMDEAKAALGENSPEFKALFTDKTDALFTLAQQAATNGHEAIFTRVMDEAKAALGENSPEFKALFTDKTDALFTLAQDAVTGGNEAIFTRVMDEAKAALGENSPEFKALFTDKTDALFTLVQQAAINGHEAIFTRVMDEAKMVLGEKSLEFKALFTDKTNTLSMLAQHAATSGNEIIFTRVMDEAKAAFGEKSPEFKTMFTDKTDALFTLVQHAAIGGNEAVFTRATSEAKAVMIEHAERAAIYSDTDAQLFHILHSLAKWAPNNIIHNVLCDAHEELGDGFLVWVNAENSFGFTPLDTALIKNKDPDAAETIRSFGGQTNKYDPNKYIYTNDDTQAVAMTFRSRAPLGLVA